MFVFHLFYVFNVFILLIYLLIYPSYFIYLLIYSVYFIYLLIFFFFFFFFLEFYVNNYHFHFTQLQMNESNIASARLEVTKVFDEKIQEVIKSSRERTSAIEKKHQDHVTQLTAIISNLQVNKILDCASLYLFRWSWH